MSAYKARSPFQPPHISGYKRPTNSMMSQQKRVQQPKKQQKLEQNSLKLTASTYDKKFCFQLKNPHPDDDTLYWRYPITSQVSNQYLRFLIFKQQQYFLRNIPQDGLVQTIYIVADDIQGYSDENGSITNKVCTLRLSGTYAARDSAGIKYYDLLYRQTQDLAWKIPMQVGFLNLRIYSGDTPLSGALETPLLTQFQIKHIGK